MFSKFYIRTVGVVVAFATIISISGGTVAYANHSWGGYHWARTSNSFTLQLENDLTTSQWRAHLAVASTDWSVSSVLDTTVIDLRKPTTNCNAILGKDVVCNKKYGFNGWLGVAQIWINSDGHISQGVVKLNDSYFDTSTYNTPAWRQFVTCQEVGHTFGLNHQDEVFTNANLGTCMDYTNTPSTNQHPNQHDYDQLVSIYSHLDTFTTIKTTALSKANPADLQADDSPVWGKGIKKDSKGHTSLFERDLEKGEKLLTFVLWSE